MSHRGCRPTPGTGYRPSGSPCRVMAVDLRRRLKPPIERLLASGLARWIGTRRRREQCLILAYHNVIPEGSAPGGDQSLHLGFDQFRRQADALATGKRVVPLAQALEPGRDDPRYAITFDDAYAGAVSLALPELASRGLPATLFVAPGLLGQSLTWWDALADPRGLTDSLRTAGLDELEGDGERILARAVQEGRTPVRDERFRIASEAELARAAALEGLSLGAHSWNHLNLSRIGDQQLDHELAAPLAWLLERFPNRTGRWLAYPYGLFDDRVTSRAAQAGYSAGFAIKGGWHRPRDARLRLPRLNVPAGLSPAGLMSRLNGVLDL